MDLKTLKRVIGYTKPYKISLILAFLSSIIGIGFTLVSPVLVGKSIDLILGVNMVDFNGIFQLLISLVIFVILGAIFQWISNVCTSNLTYRVVRDLRKEIIEKVNKVPLKYIDSKPHGDIISRIINDIDAISDGLLQSLTQLFSGIITILGTFLFMLYVNPIITAVVVVLTPLSIFIAAFISKSSYKYFREQSDIQGDITAYVSEVFSSQKIVKSFSYEQRSFEKFQELNKKLYSVGVKSQFFSSLANPGTRFVNSIVYTAVGIIGAYITIFNGTMTIGAIASFLSYANQYTKPFNEITGVITQIQSAFAGARRVFELFDEEEEKDIDGAIDLKSVEGHVKLENVSFSYTPEIKIIKNLNLDVAPGKKVAITGPTGSGKTTIINLLMRFYDVDEGVIKIDGIPINNIKRDSLRRLYGMVLQDTWLYSASIRENIAFGKPDATDEEIILASKGAQAHSFIEKLENGYDTVISENAENISQGQKQLLCISRVMLLNHSMQILDEATSNIDTMTEQRIQTAFNKMTKGKTSFIVAHRLSTIRDADIRVEVSNNIYYLIV